MRTRIVLGDAGYPTRLLRLKRPPPEITLSGDIESAGTRVAIVGARAATREASMFARTLAREVVLRGGVVVSGGARGIDGAAHEAALEAGGATWVVAPTGADGCFPEEHADLFARVEASPLGAMIWPFPADTEAATPRFLFRNAILAAVADVVVIAQAGPHSGSLHAAQAARRLTRPVWVVAAPPWLPGFEGGNALVGESGARAVVDVDQLLAALFPTQCALDLVDRTPPDPPPDLTPRAMTILGVMGAEPQHLETIAEKADILLYLTSNELLTLALGNVVVEGPPGWFRRAPRR